LEKGRIEFSDSDTLATPIKQGNEINGCSGQFVDITERKQTENLLRARLHLMDFATSHSIEEVLQKTLDEIGKIVDSPIGFYHFVGEDQKTLSLQAWSTRTLREFCTVSGKGLHYNVQDAGFGSIAYINELLLSITIMLPYPP